MQKSAKTPELASTHTALGPAPLWHRKHPVEHLPDYIENIAKALERNGHSEQEAVRLAVGAVKRWASGKGRVHPEVRAAAAAAVREWEKLKAAKQLPAGDSPGQVSMTARRRKRKPSGKRAVKAVISALPAAARAPQPEMQRKAAALLSDVADALNACEAAGVMVRLRYDSVLSSWGYVLPLWERPPRYAARSRLLAEFPLPPGSGRDQGSGAALSAGSYLFLHPPAHTANFGRPAAWHAVDTVRSRVAATLTDSGELTKADVFYSFGIEKVESTPDGDLMVYGRATDGSVDHDQQIVDPQFSSKSIRDWLQSGGNVRVQHNPQRDPAGVGLEVSTDAEGATWVKSLIVEPVAKKLVSKGALRAYSVGIARPTIVRDAVAKGGRITDGQVVEISLVDRPANARCGIQLVAKSADGTPQYTGKVFGADDAIAKALNEPEITKDGGVTKKAADLPGPAGPAACGGGTFSMPRVQKSGEDLSVTFTPNDMARLLQHKFVQKHYDDLARQAAAETRHDDGEAALKAIADAEAPVIKRDIDTAARRRLAEEGKALSDGSYPIENTGDLHNAAVLARSGHGDVAAARRLIARRAKELGVPNPLKDGKGKKDKSASAEGESVATPDVTKKPEDSGGGENAGQGKAAGALEEAAPAGAGASRKKARDGKKARKKARDGKKLPPWLRGGDPQNGQDGMDSTPDGGHAEKCRTDPAAAAGVTASPMQPAPVSDLQESTATAAMKAGPTPASASGAEGEHMDPVPAHREPDGAEVEAFEKDSGLQDGDSEKPGRLEMPTLKSSPEVAALLRFRQAAIDPELGRLHDLTCPAFHPEDVAKCHPFADFRTVIDEAAFHRLAVEAAAGQSPDRAKAMQQAWQAARILREADPAVLNDFRLGAWKAFRDANPGPGTAPVPGSISPGKFNRPLITGGHEASSPGHAGPAAPPPAASGAPDAHDFARPPLSAGHQSPSPSFMKASWEYPAETGRPVQLRYEVTEKERARQALAAMHESLGRQFPLVCPIDLDRPVPQPQARPVPAAAGVSKSAAPDPAAAAAVFKAEPERDGQFADADLLKARRKLRRKLGRKVLSGRMTVDEARSRLGRDAAQKSRRALQRKLAVKVSKGEISIGEARAQLGLTPLAGPAAAQKAAGIPFVNQYGEPARSASVRTVAPAAPAAAGPEVIKAAVTEALAPVAAELAATKALLAEQRESYDKKLAEQQRVIDAIADQPDPSTAAFSGLAFNPVHKQRRPAGVLSQAEVAERTQQMMIRHLTDRYNSASDPAEREAAYATLCKMRGISQ
jgi:hypothetical protein